MDRFGAARALAVLLVAMCATAAWAGYREEPPKGVTLAGTTWQLDPYRSDDPQLAMRKARGEIEAQRRKAMAERRRGARGMGRGGGFPGGGGGGFPGGGGRGQSRDQGRGRGDAGPLPGDDDPYDDPTGDGDARDGRDGAPSGEAGPAGSGGPGDAGGMRGPGGRGPRGGPPGAGMLDELTHNPERLAFTGARRTLRVQSDGTGIECEAGNDTMLQDRFGYGSRRCGWDGRAWVVETKHEDGAKRIDRYETSPDGRVLTHSTSLDMKGISKVVVTRTYVPAAPVPLAPAPATP